MIPKKNPKPMHSEPAGLASSRRKFASGYKPSRKPTAKDGEHHGDDVLRFVPLGGLEEIGRNMMFFEYKNEIVIVDAGLQFAEEETPGIDYIIPNTKYLEDKKSHVQALFLTHAHYDHIGAIPHIMQRIGNPPIYTTALTKAIIEKRQTDFPNAPKLNIIVVKGKDKVKVSNHFEAEFFDVAHTIPESIGIVIKTPVGNMVNLGDFRVEYDENGNVFNLEGYKAVGDMGVHSFMIDSTNADKEGRTLSEKVVEKNLEEIFKKAEGRIIVATFASLLTRLSEIIKIAERLGRKVALSGYSMKTNIQIAQNLGFIKVKSGTIIQLEDLHKYKDDKVMILSTGAQGESNASLMKIINGEHRQIKVKPADTIVLSASIIPGNERAVQSMKDNLARQGAIVYNSELIDIHASGHAPKDDLKLMMQIMNPKFVVPVHGYYFKRYANAKSAEDIYGKGRAIMMDNGQVGYLTKDEFKVSEETVPAYYVMVDGLGVGDVEEVVLRDRRSLAQEGMVVIITTIDKKTGRLIKNPDIISRGFIYMKENQDILEEIRKRIRGLIGRIPSYESAETDYIKTLVRDQVGQFLYNKTRRRPMIIPVMIEI